MPWPQKPYKKKHFQTIKQSTKQSINQSINQSVNGGDRWPLSVMDPHGTPWVPMGTKGIPGYIPGYARVFEGTLGYPHTQGPLRHLGIPRGTLGYPRGTLGSHGVLWVIPQAYPRVPHCFCSHGSLIRSFLASSPFDRSAGRKRAAPPGSAPDSAKKASH